MRMPILCGHPCLFVPVSYDRRVWASLFTLCVRRGMGGSRINNNQMKRFYQILAALALVVSMQGCSNDASESISFTKVELKLKGEIQAPLSGTRVNANGFESNNQVGVYVSSTGSLALQDNVLDNVVYKYSNGNLVASDDDGKAFWDTKDTELSVYAYYPYSANVVNNSAYEFSVNSNQSVEANYYDSDFITAQNEGVEPQEGAVSLTFNHSLSKVNVSLIAGKGITSDELAELDKEFTISGLVTSGTIDLATGVATAGTTKATITPLVSNGKDYSAIVYPQSGAVTFYMELDGEIFSYTTNVNFAAGYQYQFNLTINTWESPQMTLASTAIDTWEDGEEQSGVMSGTISFPDAAFKRNILSNQLFAQNEYGGAGELIGDSIDVNGDGEISCDEANAVYHLTIGNMGQNVTNLSGLEYFTNLEYLVIVQSSISSIDLSANTSLVNLDFMSNPGTVTLKLSNNPNLKRIGCGNNSQLKTLDISGAPSLEELACNDNAIEVLDVSNNPALSTVRLNSESGLQTIYVSSTQNTEGWSLPEGVTPTVKGE